MILVTQTIVHKSAVMIEFLHTALTVCAVKSPSRLDYSAIETEIVQIYALLIR